MLKHRSLICLLAYGFLLSACDAPVIGESNSISKTNPITIVMHCQPDQSFCTANVAEQEITLTPSPANLPPMQNLSFQVKHRGQTHATMTRLWLTGRDMFMGQHYFDAANSAGSAVTQFRGMIPLCTQDARMLWHVNLEMKIEGVSYLLQAELKSSQNI